MKNIKTCIILLGCILLGLQAAGQETVRLDLASTIRMANDSSLTAFRNRNMYLKGYWEHQTFKANRLPLLSLDLSPAQYYRYITPRYDSQEDMDVYREQQMFSAGGALKLQQNLDITGGTFYVESALERMYNSGETRYSQFSSIPVRIGYSQELIGFNALKWEKKIEPLKFEKVKKEFLYNSEMVSEEAVTYFFNVAMAQLDYEMALKQVESSDTLYKIGMQRHKIAAISKADLLTLELDMVIARNSLENSRISLKRATFALASFLNLEKDIKIEVELPERPGELVIPMETALEMAMANSPSLLEHQQTILEAEREVSRTKAESYLNASVNLSVGFNQVADNLKNAYRHPLQQDIISVNLNVPIVDWGVRKGRHNMAKNDLNVAEISARQKEAGLEEEVFITVEDFNIQKGLIGSAEEALKLADMAYAQTMQRFMIGKADVNSMAMALSRKQEAQRNWLHTLQNYWLNYYKIRRLTLYDFEAGASLSEMFDYSSIIY